MKSKTVKGMVVTRLGVEFKKVTIRSERTGAFTTLSLADDDKQILLEVNYKDIKDVVRVL